MSAGPKELQCISAGCSPVFLRTWFTIELAVFTAAEMLLSALPTICAVVPATSWLTWLLSCPAALALFVTWAMISCAKRSKVSCSLYAIYSRQRRQCTHCLGSQNVDGDLLTCSVCWYFPSSDDATCCVAGWTFWTPAVVLHERESAKQQKTSGRPGHDDPSSESLT